MSTRGAFVVIGSGPGVGRSTAAHFAKNGFKHVVLLSRNEERLAEDARAVITAVPDAKVDILTIDVSADEASLKKCLSDLDKKLGCTPLEVVLYNAARVGPSKILEWDASGLEQDLRMTTVSLYITLQWAVPKLLETAKSDSYNPAFFTTSGKLWREPFPFLFSLSAGKAAQHSLINSFHQKYGPQIHFSLVPVGGMISDDAKVTTAAAVADEFWKLYKQPKGVNGQLSVEMDDPDYYPGVEAFRRHVEGS